MTNELNSYTDVPLVKLLDEDDISICLLYLKDQPATILRPILPQHDAHVLDYYLTTDLDNIL